MFKNLTGEDFIRLAGLGDEEVWRTSKDKSNPDGTGRRFKIDTDTGEIRAGFGNKFNGKTPKEAFGHGGASASGEPEAQPSPEEEQQRKAAVLQRLKEAYSYLSDDKLADVVAPFENAPPETIAWLKKLLSKPSWWLEGQREKAAAATAATAAVKSRLTQAFAHLGDADRADFVDAFVDAPEEILTKLEAYGGQVKYSRPASTNGKYEAYCAVLRREVVISLAIHTQRTLDVIRHEMGHFLDHEILESQKQLSLVRSPERFASSSGSLGRAIRRDIMRTATEKGFWDRIVNTIKADPLCDNEHVTGFFDSMTRGKVFDSGRKGLVNFGRTVYGHEPSDFARCYDLAATEVFADFFALYSAGQKREIELLRRFYPDTVQELERVLKK